MTLNWRLRASQIAANCHNLRPIFGLLLATRRRPQIIVAAGWTNSNSNSNANANADSNPKSSPKILSPTLRRSACWFWRRFGRRCERPFGSASSSSQFESDSEFESAFESQVRVRIRIRILGRPTLGSGRSIGSKRTSAIEANAHNPRSLVFARGRKRGPPDKRIPCCCASGRRFGRASHLFAVGWLGARPNPLKRPLPSPVGKFAASVFAARCLISHLAGCGEHLNKFQRLKLLGFRVMKMQKAAEFGFEFEFEFEFGFRSQVGVEFFARPICSRV